MTLVASDKARSSRQVDLLLTMLRRGPVTNSDLIAAGLYKYTSRISDARKLGHVIDCERREGGLSVYRLIRREPEQLSIL
jgi:hypothetical protein